MPHEKIMAFSIKHTKNEVLYRAQRTWRYGLGQTARVGARLLTVAGATAAGVSGSAGAFYSMGLIGIGTGVGLQAYMNDEDYKHNVAQLGSMYQKEISAYLEVPSSEIDATHLEQLAEINPTIQQQLDKERMIRNIRTGAVIAAGVLGFMAVVSVVATMAPVGVAVAFSTKVMAGMAGFATIKLSQPVLQAAIENKYEINRPTTHEVIKRLQRKKDKVQHINQQQVMEAYLSAKPELEQEIIEEFGAPLGALTIADQQRVLLEYGEAFNIEEVTLAINENRLDPRELIFRVHGEESGAYPDPSYREMFNTQISHAKHKAQTLQKNVTERGQAALSTAKSFVTGASTPEPTKMKESLNSKFQDAELARRAATAVGQGPKI